MVLQSPSYIPACSAISTLGSWKPDPKVTNRDKMIALGYGMALLPANDEETMVNGLTFLVDFEGFTIRHQTFYGLDTMKKTTKMWTVIIIDQLG